MRILTGKFKGRNVYMPMGIRPTQNITRKAIFDLLGNDLTGLTFLELYAGSGAVGLEALSLGAKKVVFVERLPLCVETIAENLKLLGVPTGYVEEAAAEVLQADSVAQIKQFSLQKKMFDVVFFDPPYGQGLVKKILKTLMTYVILAPNSFVVVEHSQETLPDSEGFFSVLKERQYGKSCLTILQWNAK